MMVVIDETATAHEVFRDLKIHVKINETGVTARGRRKS
jgi:hypothetical protein